MDDVAMPPHTEYVPPHDVALPSGGASSYEAFRADPLAVLRRFAEMPGGSGTLDGAAGPIVCFTNATDVAAALAAESAATRDAFAADRGDAEHALVADLVARHLTGWTTGRVRDFAVDAAELGARIACGVLFGTNRTETVKAVDATLVRWNRVYHARQTAQLFGRLDDQPSEDDFSQAKYAATTAIRELVAWHPHDASFDEDFEHPADADYLLRLAARYIEFRTGFADGLVWTMFLLAQHPHIGRRVRAESCLANGRYDGPTMCDVVRESRRCFPENVYRIGRIPTETMIGSRTISADTRVIVSPFFASHTEDAHAEPYRFLPERWSRAKSSPAARTMGLAEGATYASEERWEPALRIALGAIWREFSLTVTPGAKIDGTIVAGRLTPGLGMPMLIARPNAPAANHWVRGNIHELVKLDWPESPKAALPRAA